ncbi:PspC domain-containing protein [Saccharomonospora iraqiensis]|uniref:PspC domain-containing protein n=1 Tax=Saccharomonospora iraqiensis TaxID=52698 RepID=UPI00047C3362|nr:PspC domain-containing protein [Saccharomonospora iraqiensis]
MTTTGVRRSRDNRMIGGVCAGLARRFDMRPRTVRLLFVLSCLLPGPQFVLYLVLWIVLPED